MRGASHFMAKVPSAVASTRLPLPTAESPKSSWNSSGRRNGCAPWVMRVREPAITDVPKLGRFLGAAAKYLGRFRGDGGDIDLGDVSVPVGRPVKGVVVDLEEKPVRAGDVGLWLAGVQVGATQTDDAGKFEFDAVGDDPHVVQAYEPPEIGRASCRERV